ncbi:unnamed protein product [Paramecium primaurelia]|uniref:Uncharacterized protein n=1 Tax=Paramecium primaurelia TaxID=5886 RepID=A0A8S1NPV4_PARPR|nr:unnamed protein product [Paramecium primaurelia]
MDIKETHKEIQMQKRHKEKKLRNLALQKSTDYMKDNNLDQFKELFNKKDELDDTEKKKFFEMKNELKKAYIGQYRILTTGWQTQKQEKLQGDKGQNKTAQYQKKHILDD